jgi:small-conductance mechanosensitive channel
VQLGDLGGEVQEIGMRASIVRTGDGAEVLVPNSHLVSEKVVNWTLSDRMRRITLKVGVAYGSDPERVIELLRDVALQHPRALRQPPPIAVFRGFGESSMDFELWVWTDRFEDGAVLQSDLGVAVHSALGAAKVEIAMPQRVVHVRDGEGGHLGLSATAAPGGSEGSPAPSGG